MKLYNKKILFEYAIEKANGNKPFEIRKNDCDYQVGDLIHYDVIVDDKNYEHACYDGVKHYFERAIFEITYITSYEQKDGYVVFGERQVNKDVKYVITPCMVFND